MLAIKIIMTIIWSIHLLLFGFALFLNIKEEELNPALVTFEIVSISIDILTIIVLWVK